VAKKKKHENKAAKAPKLANLPPAEQANTATTYAT